ncbi:MAG: RDD family protein [Methanophagales archaeon]|nr:RDD family protein [Methanophagales archaeon]
MFCPKCGKEVKEGAKFCNSCGSPIEHIKETEVTEVGKRFCPKCGAELVGGMKFCSSCGARISELGMEKADAGARFGSYIIDGVIVTVISYALIIPLCMSGVEYAAVSWIGLPISIGYFTYFFGNGQTLGMKAVKIKLCGTDGTYPIGYGRGFLRWIGMIISGLVIGLGYLWILIDKNKQGWHDKIADTYVVVE